MSHISKDFRDESVIISRYMQAQDDYDKYTKLKDIDQNRAEQLLNTASEKLYQVYELGMKHHLNKRYPNLPSERGMSVPEKNQRLRALSNVKYKYGSKNQSVTTNYLKEQMELYADPAVAVSSVNLDLIQRNCRGGNNDSKHQGKNVSEGIFVTVNREIRKFILVYINSNAAIQGRQSSEFINLMEHCNFWKKSPRYNLCLIADKLELNSTELKSIMSIPWSLIIDLDQSTDEVGLNRAYFDLYGSQANVFSLLQPNRTVFDVSSNAPYWYFVNGLLSDSRSIPNGAGRGLMRRWYQMYGNGLADSIIKYHTCFSKNVKVIVLSGEYEKVNEVLKAIDSAYDGEEDIILTSTEPQYEPLLVNYQGNIKLIPVSVKEFARNMEQYSSTEEIARSKSGKNMVSREGETVIDPNVFTHFYTLYEGIEDEDRDDKIDAENYYLGKQVLSWYGVKNGFAISRKKQLRKYKMDIMEAVKDIPYRLIELWHEPGSGGTTLSRQIAFELKNDIPVVLLKMYIENYTRQQLSQLYSLVHMSILIVIDGGSFNPDDVNKLHRELRSTGIAHVILYVRRIHNKAKRNDMVLSYLSDIEFDNMAEKLLPYMEEEKISAVKRLKTRINDRYPFFMSLYAFEERFIGVEDYVKRFIVSAQKSDQEVLKYLALVDKYADKMIPLSFFPNVDSDDSVGVFVDDENDALVSLVGEDTNTPFLKMRHPRFAAIILDILSHKIDGVSDYQIAVNLTGLVIDFIKYSKSNMCVDYDSTVEIIKNLLITRDASSMIKDAFAPIIVAISQLIGDEQSRIVEVGRIFKTLVETYPDEPHFKAHLSRFYTNMEKNYIKGIETSCSALDVSIENGEKDPLLYHICAMSYRRYVEKKLYDEAIAESYYENSDFNSVIKLIRENLENASGLFEFVRSTNKKSAGYISEIEMCIGVVDFGKKLYNCSTQEFVEKHKDSWIMIYYDKAITLMEGFRNLQSEEEGDYYATKLETKYINAFSDLTQSVDRTIKLWQDYLETAIGAGKILARRFIARSKLDRSDPIDQKDILEIRDMMEKNMQEEPENAANVRIWMSAIRMLKTKNPEVLLDDAFSKINIWKECSNSLEALYYYYVLLCIKAINNSSQAEGNIPYALQALKDKSQNATFNNVVHEWYGKGIGISSIFSAYKNQDHNRKRLTYDEIVARGEPIEGRILSYQSERSAIISAYGMEVFFTPSGPKGAKQTITPYDVGKKVRFIVGFSYDGARALNKSVEIISNSTEEDTYEQFIGKKMKFTVVNINTNRKSLRLRASELRQRYGFIRSDELIDGKRIEDYAVGEVVYARVTGVNEYNGIKHFELTMRDYEDSFRRKLAELNLQG